MNNESQEEVLAFLGDPETHGDQKVHRIDTHAAAVFLAGDRALKIKRAVRFPFLDYSTLGKRREACEAELAVNAPYAPEIYRGVKAITREADGRLAIGGSGSAIEWAVEMRRFDEQRTLDHLAGEIDDALAEALGRAVAAAHAKAPAVEAKAWIDAVGSYIDEHTEAFGAHTDIFPAAEIDALARVSRTAYDRIVPLLTERGRRGLIRRIHGDLHLGNIVLIDGRPVLFDAIEFSDIIASGDVLYDLAFLLMDLLERGLTRPASIVFNRYLAETRRADDLDALAALPFFLSMRAAIRAKVTAARMELAPPAERPPIARAARGYFALALEAIAPPAPKLVAVGGLSGTGKTVLARAVAPRLKPMPGAVIVRSDIERKALFGIAETEKLPADAYERGSHRSRLRNADGEGAPHPCRRPFGDRRRRVCRSARACRPRSDGEIREHSAARTVSHRRPRHPDRPGRLARARRLRCRRQRGAGTGALRPRTARMDGCRCLRNAGGNPGAGMRRAP